MRTKTNFHCQEVSGKNRCFGCLPSTRIFIQPFLRSTCRKGFHRPLPRFPGWKSGAPSLLSTSCVPAEAACRVLPRAVPVQASAEPREGAAAITLASSVRTSPIRTSPIPNNRVKKVFAISRAEARECFFQPRKLFWGDSGFQPITKTILPRNNGRRLPKVVPFVDCVDWPYFGLQPTNSFLIDEAHTRNFE
jgi:hypothetical protein